MCHFNSEGAKQNRIKTHCLLKPLKCYLLLNPSQHQNPQICCSVSFLWFLPHCFPPWSPCYVHSSFWSSRTGVSSPIIILISPCSVHFPLFHSPSILLFFVFFLSFVWVPRLSSLSVSLPLFVKIILLPNWAGGWLSLRVTLHNSLH